MKDFKRTSTFLNQIQEMSDEDLLAELSDYEKKLNQLTNKTIFKEIKQGYEEYLALPKSVRKQHEEITKKLHIAEQLVSYYERIDENLYEMYILGLCDYYYIGSEDERKNAQDKVTLLKRERDILQRDYLALSNRYAEAKIPATIGAVFTNLQKKINMIKKELDNRNSKNKINKQAV